MADTPLKPPNGVRLALVLGGIAAVAFGAAILLWPTKAALAMTLLIAIYAVIAGLVYAGAGLFSRTLGAGGRIGHVLLGLLYVVAGVFALGELQQTAVFLALFLSVLVGVLWIVEGVVSLFTLGTSGSKTLTVVFAVVSVVAGLALLTSPLWGAVFLWWFAGLALIVLGSLNVVRALFGRNG